MGLSAGVSVKISIMYRLFLFLLGIAGFVAGPMANAQSVIGKMDYFGQRPPGDAAVLFANGVVSDAMANRDFTISPAGDEIFYTVQQRDFLSSTIIRIKKSNGKWGQPEVAPFSGRYNDLEATFTADGKKLFFSSNRPVKEGEQKEDFDIWFTQLENGRWSKPVHLDSPVNSAKDEFYPSVTKNGNIYFTSQLESGKGKEDIVVCEWKDGKYSAPKSLPEAINTAGYEFNAFVDPDEQFVIFTGYARKDGMGSGDLYIARRDAQGNWLQAVNMGAKVNSPNLDYCPFVSWDKKYLFFTSNKTSFKTPFTKVVSYTDLKKALMSAENGFDNIYWINFAP